MGAIWYLYLIFLIFLSAGLVHRILIKEDVEDIFITTDPSRAGNGHKLDSHPPIIGTPIVDGDVKVVPRSWSPPPESQADNHHPKSYLDPWWCEALTLDVGSPIWAVGARVAHMPEVDGGNCHWCIIGQGGHRYGEGGEGGT